MDGVGVVDELPVGAGGGEFGLQAGDVFGGDVGVGGAVEHEDAGFHLAGLGREFGVEAAVEADHTGDVGA